MNKQVRNKWGYIPMAVGFILIAVGVGMLFTHVVVNNGLATPNSDFWFNWAPMITFLLIAGALSTVVGVLVSMKIRNMLSYASVAGGFLLVSLDSYFLIGEWIKVMVNVISLSNFYPSQAVGFFLWLMAGVFLVVFGLIFGLRVRSKWGVISVAGGSVLLLLAVCLLILDVLATIAIDPVFGLRDFRWYFFWENFTLVIPFSLVVGGFFVFVGLLLMRKRNQIIA